VRCIAHRGFAADAPENTLRAVRRAAAVGADAVEVDVRASKEGTPVVIHDSTVDRVTESSGPVDSFTADELGQLDVLGTGTGIPTLRDLLDSVPDSPALVLEFKETGLAENVGRLVGNVRNDVLVSSFVPAALDEVAAATTLPRALLVTGEAPDPIAQAVDLGCSAVHVAYEACDEAFVRRAHDAGLAVEPWTVEEVAEARRLERAGADGLIADAADCCGLAGE